MIINPSSRTRLIWRMEPRAAAAEQLRQLGNPAPHSASATDTVSVLYATRRDVAPKALTLLDYCNDGSDRRLEREAATDNRFDLWFADHRDADIWTLAAAWQFYSAWVTGFNVPDLQACLSLSFAPDPFLDQVLAHSHGWILWKFQIELVCQMALRDRNFARYVAEAWWMQAWEDTMMPLPDHHLSSNHTLASVLVERSWRERHGRIMSFDEPNLRLAYALKNVP